jgi:hypothetical protein
VTIDSENYLVIPGGELVAQGLNDIRSGCVTEHALLLLVASPRLARLGILVPPLPNVKPPEKEPYEHQLYSLLQDRGGYSMYNSLLRRMASFASCLEREKSGKKLTD